MLVCWNFRRLGVARTTFKLKSATASYKTTYLAHIFQLSFFFQIARCYFLQKCICTQPNFRRIKLQRHLWHQGNLYLQIHIHHHDFPTHRGENKLWIADTVIHSQPPPPPADSPNKFLSMPPPPPNQRLIPPPLLNNNFQVINQ